MKIFNKLLEFKLLQKKKLQYNNFYYIYFLILPTVIVFYLFLSSSIGLLTKRLYGDNFPGFENPLKLIIFSILLFFIQLFFLLKKERVLNFIEDLFDFSLLKIILLIIIFEISIIFFINVRLNRSFIFTFLTLPILIYYTSYYLKRLFSKRKTKFIYFFYLIFLFMIFVPGFYAPPFYGGIKGWHFIVGDDLAFNNKDGEKIVNNSYIAMQNSEDKIVLYSNAFSNPSNFTHRPRSFYQLFNLSEKVKKYDTYLYQTFCEQFKHISKGYYSQNKILGNFSFPGHNSYVFLDDYKDFNPKYITSIGKLTTSYNTVTGEFIKYNYKPETLIEEKCLP